MEYQKEQEIFLYGTPEGTCLHSMNRTRIRLVTSTADYLFTVSMERFTLIIL